MPFYDTADEAPQVRAPTAVEPPNPRKPLLSDVVGAAFLQDNTLVNLARRSFEEQYPPDPDGHNPVNFIRGTPYEEFHADRFIESRSASETQAIMRRIDEEDADRRTLEAGGFAGTVASIGAGLIDPTLALPAGTIYRAGKAGYALTRSAISVGLAAGAQTALQEGVLQATQETRSLAQSTAAIASSTILGGLIGGGAAGLLSRVERGALEKALDHERAAIDAHANGRPMPAPAGAAAADERELQLEFSGLGFTSGLSPTRRVLSGQSVEARRTMADLAETPYRFKEGAEGVAATQGPALDRLARMEIQGTRVEISDGLDKLFAEYRFGDADKSFPRARATFEQLTGQNTEKMSFADFKNEVSRALQEGDQHEIPQVKQAADMIRQRVFEPWKERAIRAGLLPEEPDVKTADSYFQRVYNKERITAQRPEFVNKVVDWLKSDQDAKRAAQVRLSALNDELEKARFSIVKAKSEEDTLLAVTHHDEVRSKMEAELAAWDGKTSVEAKAALKAREKYAAESAIKFGEKHGVGAKRPDTAERLKGADDAVDRAVAKILESDRELGIDDLRGRAHEITDRILSSPDGRLPYDIEMGGPEIGWTPKGGEPARGPLARREFNIPDATIRDFLEQDAEAVVAAHLRTIIPDVLLTEKFGDVRMTEALKKIQEDYAARIDTTKSEKERKALAAERDGAIRDIAAVRDRIRGVYGWSPDTRNMARIAGGAKIVNNLTSMGSAAISSLPDFAGAVFRYGFATTFKDGWVPFVRGLIGDEGAKEAFGKFKTQMRAVGIGIETSTNARQHAIDDVMDVYKPQSRVERALQNVNDKFFIANLLAPLTDMQKTIAAHVSVSEMLRATKAVAAGSATKRQIANLAESGIDAHMANRIWEQFGKGGEVVDGVHLPNTADWTDGAAADALNGAVAREVDIAVVTPGQEKPLWMSQPVISLLGQFKAFTASSTERILIANLQRRDTAALQGLIASIGLGMMSYKVNSLTGGQKTSDRPQDWLKEGISRGGVLGWFEEGNALASKMTRGQADIYRMVGADKPLSRFASRSVLDLFLGPTAGKITGLAKVTGAAASRDWTEGDTTALRRLTAFQNLFYVRGLLNQVEGGFNRSLDIPMKDKP